MKVAVVGGGVIGLCCARELARRGAEVTLVERDDCGQAASSGNAGWIVPSLSMPIPEPGATATALRWMFAPNSPFRLRPRLDPALLGWCWRFWRASSRKRWLAGTAALVLLNGRTPELFDDLCATGVDFEMYNGGLVFAARSPKAVAEYREHLAALAAGGYRGATDEWDAAEVRDREPALADGLAGAIRIVGDRHVRPESLARGLLDWNRANGVDVREHAPVESLARSGSTWTIRLPDDSLVADRVVVAAGIWSARLLHPLGVRLQLLAAKGYSVTATGTGTAPRHPLYLAEAKIGVSPFKGAVRIAGTLELGATDLGTNSGRMDALLRATQPYLRDWQPTEPRVDWAGLRPLAPDGLPLIGAVPGHEGLFVATGHGMIGVTLAPATATALAPLVVDGHLEPALEPFRLNRPGL
jgi:D-amino-acid dehydrogenase